MKKLFLLIVLCTNLCYSQTKVETEEWILNKINTYGLNILTNNVRLQYNIKNGYLIQVWNKPDGSTITQSVLISDIGSFRYEVFEPNELSNGGVHIYLDCKGSSNCISFLNKKFKYFQIDFGYNFKNDNLPERMKKAITNLVKFYGSSLIDEKY